MQTTIDSKTNHSPKAVILITLCLLLASMALDYPELVDGNFFSDCATYYGLAGSLAYDFDIEYAREDIQRIYAEFSGGPSGIFLQRNPETSSLYYGKSYLYPLWVSLFMRFLGNDGILVSHAILLALLLGGIVKLWQRHWGYWSSLWLAIAFTFASTAVVFYFWAAPEFFNMVVIFYAFFLVLYRDLNPPVEGEKRPGLLRRFFLSNTAVALGFALAGAATFSKASNGLYFLPLLVYLLYKKRIRLAALALIAFLVATIGLFGIQQWQAGNWNYQGGDRTSFHSEFPFANGKDYESAGGNPTVTNPGEWEFPFFPKDIASNMTYFLFGRFGGMFAYFAPAFLILLMMVFRRLDQLEYYLIAAALALALLAWAISPLMPAATQLVPFIFPVTLALILLTSLRRGTAVENTALLSILAMAMVFIILIPTNVIGGGGTVGNRYFFNIYPLFLFLLPRRPKEWVPLASFALAFFFIGHIILNPVHHSRHPSEYGGTAHLKLLPVEYTMLNDLPINTLSDKRRIPWYAVENGEAARYKEGAFKGELNILFYLYHLDENSFVKEPNPNAWFRGPDGELTRNLVLEGGRQHVWTKGGTLAEFILRSGEPLEEIKVIVATPKTENSGWLEINGEKHEFELEPNSRTELIFEARDPYAYHYLSTSYVYHLKVWTRTGIAPRTVEDSNSNDWRYLGARLEFEVK